MYYNQKISKTFPVKRFFAKTLILVLMVCLIVPFFSAVSYADFDTSNVRVNQIGYLPQADKVATIISAATSPISWELRNASNVAVTSGMTIVRGLDPASQDNVHHATFTNYTTIGTYTLWVNGLGSSVPFEIKNDLYPTMSRDAMAYFYFHRLGENLTGFSGTDFSAYYRPAIHPLDNATPCYYPVAADQYGGRVETPLGPDWCGGQLLDVKNSWADAGDFGIYPVNHAISAWTLLNLFERYPNAFPDGSLRLSTAERTNGVPDILDEVNFGSTYLKGMLPTNTSYLASHKVTNDDFGVRPGLPPYWIEPWEVTTTTLYDWNVLAGTTNPSLIFNTQAEAYVDFENFHNKYIVGPAGIPAGQTQATLRYAQRGTTASTYAVARTLAQLARVLDQYPATAAQANSYWVAAEDAWNRAETLPVVLKTQVDHSNSDPNSRLQESPGGGDYPDSKISDDRYAAAVELYLTAHKRSDTTKPTYRTAVTSSADYMKIDHFDWAEVSGSASLSLITAPNDLPAANITQMEDALLTYANAQLTTLGAQGYPTPLAPTLNGGTYQYPWGSNSFVVNKMMMMGYAFDISKKRTPATPNLSYVKGVFKSMDYLMGNNPMKLSYVTGYGDFSETDTHDRVGWSLYNHANIPYPKGWLSGGPNNTDNNDGITPTGMPAAKTYANPGDGKTAYASKENTINWNAPFAWVTEYMNQNQSYLAGGVVQPPGAFTLTATPGNTVVNLSWTASAGAVTYNVQRAATTAGPFTTIVSGLTTTAYQNTGLTNGTSYSYRVVAVNTAGSTNSNVVSATPVGVVPGAFTLSATPGNTVVNLSWTASAGAVTYNVQRAATTAGPFTTIVSGLTTTAYQNTGLTNGTSYSYRVVAVNTTGSTNSNVVSATPVGVVPGAFTLTATPGNTVVNLSWTASAGAATYNVQRAATTAGPFTTIVSGLTTTAYQNTGLTNGTSYSYRVVAVNATGSTNSNVVSATPVGVSSNLVLEYRAFDTNATDSQMKPHFRIVNNGTSAVNLSNLTIRYWYTKDSTQADQLVCDWATIGCANISASFASMTTPVTNADSYVTLSFSSGTIPAGGNSGEIQVRINRVNWSNYNEANDYSFVPSLTSFTPSDKVTLYQSGSLVYGIEPGGIVVNNPPLAPTGLTATAGNGQVSLAWNASATANTYTVLRSTTNGGPYTTVQTGLTSTSFTNTGLTNGTTYYYVVTATNAYGTSSNSSQVSAIPTNVVTGSLLVQFRTNNTNTSDNGINVGFSVKNTGTTTVNMNTLKIRYYFTADSNQPVNYFCDFYAGGCANVQAQIVTLSTPVNGADRYLEVSFLTGSVAAGQSVEVQNRLHKGDWSNFNETDDYSFDLSKTAFADWNKVTLWQNNTLVWGIQP